MSGLAAGVQVRRQEEEIETDTPIHTRERDKQDRPWRGVQGGWI